MTNAPRPQRALLEQAAGDAPASLAAMVALPLHATIAWRTSTGELRWELDLSEDQCGRGVVWLEATSPRARAGQTPPTSSAASQPHALGGASLRWELCPTANTGEAWLHVDSVPGPSGEGGVALRASLLLHTDQGEAAASLMTASVARAGLVRARLVHAVTDAWARAAGAGGQGVAGGRYDVPEVRVVHSGDQSLACS